MAMLPSVFNSEDHEPMTDFTPIPNGWYQFEIVKSEIKLTKAKTGKRMNLQAKVVEAEEKKHEGRLVFIGLNLENPNATAVEISLRELRSLCDAVDVPALEDTVELHDIPFWGLVSIETSEGYPDKNVIKKYAKEKPE